MLILAFGLTVAHAASSKPVWVCAEASGLSAAQDQPCAPDQSFVRGYNGAQAPQVLVQPRLGAATVAVSAREPKFAPIKATDTSNMFAPIVRVVWQGVFVLIVALIAITAAKVYLFRASHRAVSGFLGDGSANAAKGLLSPGPRRRSRGRQRSDPTLTADRVFDLMTESLRSRNARSSPPQQPSLPPSPTEWTLPLLHDLEWKRFEEVCEGFWKAKGYNARLTGAGADGGVDVILPDRQDASRIFAVIQCKARSSWVGVETVRALWGATHHFGAKMAIFYGLSGFSPDAKAFAAGKHLVLVDGEALLKQIRTLPADRAAALLTQVTRGDYRTPTCAKCEKKMIRRTGREGQSDFWSCQTFRNCKTGTIPVSTSEL